MDYNTASHTMQQVTQPPSFGPQPQPVDDAGSQTSHIHATLDELQQQKELLRNQIEHLQLMVKERDEYIASLLSHAQKTVQG